MSVSIVDKVINQITVVQSMIHASYPNWYQYKYDGDNYYIEDGGYDMFDEGNMVWYFCLISLITS